MLAFFGDNRKRSRSIVYLHLQSMCFADLEFIWTFTAKPALSSLPSFCFHFKTPGCFQARRKVFPACPPSGAVPTGASFTAASVFILLAVWTTSFLSGDLAGEHASGNSTSRCLSYSVTGYHLISLKVYAYDFHITGEKTGSFDAKVFCHFWGSAGLTSLPTVALVNAVPSQSAITCICTAFCQSPVI